MGKVVRRGEAVRKEAIRLYTEGMTFAEAARVTGYGEDYVRQLCAKAGVYIPKARISGFKEREKQVLAMIADGITPKQIAESLGYASANAVYGICKKNGISVHIKSKRDENIIDMRRQGFSMNQIAQQIGENVCVISAVCRKNGVGGAIATKKEMRTCKRCGGTFEAFCGSNQLYCSKTCQKSDEHERYDPIRRVRKKSARCDDIITLSELFERDSGICHICGKPCDYSDYVVKNGKRCARGNYPSCDHIVPISKGGTHSWDNVKLAHVSCNAKKGVKPFG